MKNVEKAVNWVFNNYSSNFLFFYFIFSILVLSYIAHSSVSASFENDRLKSDMYEDEWRAERPELVEKSLAYRLFEEQHAQALTEAKLADEAGDWSRFAYRIKSQERGDVLVRTLLASTQGKNSEEILEIVKNLGDEVRREMEKYGRFRVDYMGADLLYKRPDLATRLILHDESAWQEINAMFQTNHWGDFFHQLRHRRTEDPFVQSVIERLPHKDASLEEVALAVNKISRDAVVARANGESIDFRLTAFADNPYYSARLTANNVKSAERYEALEKIVGKCAWGKYCLPVHFKSSGKKYHATPAYESYYKREVRNAWLAVGLKSFLALFAAILIGMSPVLYRRAKRYSERRQVDRREKLEVALYNALQAEVGAEDSKSPYRVRGFRISLEPNELNKACKEGRLSERTRRLAEEYVLLSEDENLLKQAG